VTRGAVRVRLGRCDRELLGRRQLRESVTIGEHVVSTPDQPTGEADGLIDTSYEYCTDGSTCTQGHTVQYVFDWGDGTANSGLVDSCASHTYTATGNYDVRAMARCTEGEESGWSTVLSVSITEHVVGVPDQPTGEADGLINTSYEYCTDGSTCTQGHTVQYVFDWGDGTANSAPADSCASHTFTVAGDYEVTARAQCTEGELSSWATALAVSMTEPLPGPPRF